MKYIVRILASLLFTGFTLTAFAADPPKEEEPFLAGLKDADLIDLAHYLGHFP